VSVAVGGDVSAPRELPETETLAEYFCADYTEPGESGNKVDVRWAALEHKDNNVTLSAVGMPLLSVNATNYRTEDLQGYKHPFEMPKRNETVLNLDLMQQGVGGDNSWGTWPHEEYLIPCKNYSYRFRLSVRKFAQTDDPFEQARARF
jgi:beta-galactosidase